MQHLVKTKTKINKEKIQLKSENFDSIMNI